MPPDEYREAQVEAAAARARAKALRPWYRKKRFILGIPLLVLVAFALGAAAQSNQEASGPIEGAPAGVASAGGSEAGSDGAEVPRVGTLVRVGDLDLTVLAAEPFDGRQYSPFNDANYRVQFRATNSRGPANAEYSLTELAFKLVDEDGVAQNGWYTACQACPDNVGGGTSIIRDGTFEGVVYFRIPPGKTAVELRYQPVFSNNRARIALR